MNPSRLRALRSFNEEVTMSDLSVLREKAEMFERRAERATDPISKRHYQEMAVHYRQLFVEHLDVEPREAD
jgi:hypothetical protein